MEFLKNKKFVYGVIIRVEWCHDLPWQGIEQDLQRWYEGHNVIIHELVHKQDMLNGSAKYPCKINLTFYANSTL